VVQNNCTFSNHRIDATVQDKTVASYGALKNMQFSGNPVQGRFSLTVIGCQCIDIPIHFAICVYVNLAKLGLMRFDYGIP